MFPAKVSEVACQVSHIGRNTFVCHTTRKNGRDAGSFLGE